jgi:PAS domain S-box-containing protein
MNAPVRAASASGPSRDEVRDARWTGHAQDFAALTAFLITSLVMTGLLRRLRLLAHAHGEQARLLDLTRDAIFVRNLDNLITYWNRGSEDLYGWKGSEAMGRVSHELLKALFPAPLNEIMETRTGYWEGELVHTRRDGSRVTTPSRWSSQRTDDGDPLGTLETNNDITQRKQAEAALRRIQETYVAEAQQLSRTGSFGWNVSTGKLFWSDESYRIFGIDAQSVPSIEFVLSRVHPDDLVLVRGVIDLGAVVTNAEACLNWLDRDPPDLGEVRLAVDSISRDGHRAICLFDRSATEFITPA